MPRRLSPLVKKLASRIRELRRAKEMTVEEAARKYGCSRRWWVSLEQGQNVSVDTLARIAKVLGAKAGDLIQDS